ncbi:hypothetical protein C0J52_07403 [Blattella germanica]|nr:hypothetical protein C0J52_07403 [Blattella germanica]
MGSRQLWLQVAALYTLYNTVIQFFSLKSVSARNKVMILGKEVTFKWLKLLPSMKPFLLFCLENMY